MAASPCIASPTLAGYVDGTLRPDERKAVEAHLSTCDDCLELVLEVARAEDGETESDAPLAEPEVPASAVTPIENPTRPWWRAVGLPIAAGLVLVAGAATIYVSSRPTPVESLTKIVGAQRPIEPQLTGGFQFGPLRSTLRGTETAADDRLAALATALRQRALESGTDEALHAAGMAQLLVGDAQGAVTTLDGLTRSAPDVAAYYADLGAAHAALYLQQGTSAEAAAAIAALERATALDASLAEPWFNRALVLEKMGRQDEAREAWARYVALSRDPEWRAEGERRRDALERSRGPR